MLHDKNITAHQASIERLYMKRKEYGRGLLNTEHKLELSTINLATHLKKTEASEERNLRKQLIIKNEELTKPYFMMLL